MQYFFILKLNDQKLQIPKTLKPDNQSIILQIFNISYPSNLITYTPHFVVILFCTQKAFDVHLLFGGNDYQILWELDCGEGVRETIIISGFGSCLCHENVQSLGEFERWWVAGLLFLLIIRWLFVGIDLHLF
jgi:hypothetical protein